MPLLAHAASLGKLSVFSSLGEPLNAEIDVFPGSDEELGSLAAALASDAVYHEQGIERTATQADVHLSVIKKENGSVVVKLNSSHSVTDPYLDMIVALTWKSANGKDENLWREYTVLLDPPAQSNIAVNNASVDVPKSVTVSKANLAGQEGSAGITVKSGDSLAAIAKRIPAAGVNLDQLLLALYLENKQAFDGENMNRLKAGSVLKVPSQETLSSVTSQRAQEEIQAHAADWSAYKAKLASVVAESTASESADTQASSGKVVTKAEEQSLPTETSPRDVVKLSKTENEQAGDATTQVDHLKDDLAAKQNTIADTDKKTSALEQQIAKMKRLLAIKSQSLTTTQNEAAPSTSKTLTPFQLQIIAAVLALLVLVLLLSRFVVRRKLVSREEIIAEALENSATATLAPASTQSHADVEEDVPQLKSFDLSSISLDFEHVLTPAAVAKSAKPIPDAFNSDFSNLLKVEPAPAIAKRVKPVAAANVPAAKKPAKATDFSDIETKLELAVAYVDMRDKRGAKKLLNEVLKEGNEVQKARAQAFMDQLK
jgi:pilus assembly protein FimV